MIHINQYLRHQIGAIIFWKQGRIDQGCGTSFDGLGSLRAYLIGKARLCHWSQCGLAIQRIAQLIATDNVHRFCDKIIIQAFGDINPLNPAAALPRIEHRTIDQCINRRIQIGIFHDIARVFTAKLEPEIGKGTCRRCLDMLAAIYRTGKIDKAE